MDVKNKVFLSLYFKKHLESKNCAYTKHLRNSL